MFFSACDIEFVFPTCERWKKTSQIDSGKETEMYKFFDSIPHLSSKVIIITLIVKLISTLSSSWPRCHPVVHPREVSVKREIEK